MDRRGEFEIVINARWLERAFFLLVIVVLAALFIWQYTAKGGASDAQSQAKIATLQSQLDDTQAKLDNVTMQLTVAKALLTPAATTTPPATTPPPTTTPPPSTVVSGGTLKVDWDHQGTNPSSTQYKLTDVTIIVKNGVDRSATFDYSMCWSSIECTHTVATGSFSVGAGADYTYHVPISIPTIVDTRSQQQTLSLTVTSDGKTVLDDTAIVK